MMSLFLNRAYFKQHPSDIRYKRQYVGMSNACLVELPLRLFVFGAEIDIALELKNRKHRGISRPVAHEETSHSGTASHLAD